MVLILHKNSTGRKEDCLYVPTHGLSFGAIKVDLRLNKASLEAIFMKNQA